MSSVQVERAKGLILCFGTPIFESTTVITENRMIDLETKMAYQENTLDTLQKVVYLQQKKIAELEELCSVMAGRFKEMAAAGNEQPMIDERPPHY